MTHRYSKTWLLGLTLGLALSTRQGHGAEPAPVRDLSNLFKVGSLVGDRDGDSFADFVNARFVLPATPTSGQIVMPRN